MKILQRNPYESFLSIFLRCFCLRNKTPVWKVFEWQDLVWGGCGDRGLCSCFYLSTLQSRAVGFVFAVMVLSYLRYAERSLGPTDCWLNPPQQRFI